MNENDVIKSPISAVGFKNGLNFTRRALYFTPQLLINRFQKQKILQNPKLEVWLIVDQQHLSQP